MIMIQLVVSLFLNQIWMKLFQLLILLIRLFRTCWKLFWNFLELTFLLGQLYTKGLIPFIAAMKVFYLSMFEGFTITFEILLYMWMVSPYAKEVRYSMNETKRFSNMDDVVNQIHVELEEKWWPLIQQQIKNGEIDSSFTKRDLGLLLLYTCNLCSWTITQHELKRVNTDGVVQPDFLLEFTKNTFLAVFRKLPLSDAPFLCRWYGLNKLTEFKVFPQNTPIATSSGLPPKDVVDALFGTSSIKRNFAYLDPTYFDCYKVVASMFPEEQEVVCFRRKGYEKLALEEVKCVPKRIKKYFAETENTDATFCRMVLLNDHSDSLNAQSREYVSLLSSSEYPPASADLSPR